MDFSNQNRIIEHVNKNEYFLPIPAKVQQLTKGNRGTTDAVKDQDPDFWADIDDFDGYADPDHFIG